MVVVSVKCKRELMPHETTQRCRFSTDRLVVEDWHGLAGRYELDLVEVVGSVLTPSTTVALPPEWRGDFDRARAERWIDTRDAESPTLLVVEQRSGDAVGLMILFEAVDDETLGGIDVRVGYVLAETSWGKGFASELVGGLVEWAESEPAVRSISGGVAADNVASGQVLLKSGFSLTSEGSDEQMYRLDT